MSGAKENPDFKARETRLMPRLPMHLVSIFLLLAPAQAARGGELKVEADFPGGSANVLEIDQTARRVRINPAPYKDRGFVCWWYFKLTGVEPNETVTLDIGEGVWATPDRAAFSLDGQTWRHTEPGQRDGKRIVFRQKVGARQVWFAWGPPFVPADAQKLVEEAAKRSPHATAFTLCQTRAKRPVPALRINEPAGGKAPAERDPAEKFGVWVQARHHAWESGSSWVCRGFVEWVMSGDPQAVALRRRADITIVPIMDIDSVADGAGGKNQRPQDHNRDWSDEPHWPSVAAAQREIARMDKAGQFDLFIDLHNPSANDKRPYFYVPPRDKLTELTRQNLIDFIAAAKRKITGPLKLADQVRESGASYDRNWQKISKNWVAFHTRDQVVAVTLETAWNTPNSTTEGYRQVGRQLGQAIERYFKTARRRDAP